MTVMRQPGPHPIPVEPRVMMQQAHGTIKQLIDALVELVTNSDDSYKRLEQQG